MTEADEANLWRVTIDELLQIFRHRQLLPPPHSESQWLFCHLTLVHGFRWGHSSWRRRGMLYWFLFRGSTRKRPSSGPISVS
jgi:hypothetical protein